MSEELQSLLREAEALVAQKEWDQALENYKKAMILDPQNEEACHKVAEIYATRGLISNVVDQYFQLIDILEAKGDLDVALEVARWIMKLQPENVQARMKTILIHQKRGNQEEVVRQSLHLARLYIELGQGDQSIMLLRKAQETAPDNLDIGLELAEMYKSHGYIQEAAAQYRRIANAFLEKGMLEKAADTFRRMKVVISDDSQLLYTLGNIYVNLGRYNEAEAEFRAILRLDLNNVDALMALGNVCQQKGQYRDAILAFNKILSLNPQDVLAKEKMGELNQAQGNTVESIKNYLAAAHIYQSTDNVERAIKLYQRVLTMDPTNPTACRELTNLGAPLVGEEEKEPITPFQPPVTKLLDQVVRLVEEPAPAGYEAPEATVKPELVAPVEAVSPAKPAAKAVAPEAKEQPATAEEEEDVLLQEGAVEVPKPSLSRGKVSGLVRRQGAGKGGLIPKPGLTRARGESQRGGLVKPRLSRKGEEGEEEPVRQGLLRTRGPRETEEKPKLTRKKKERPPAPVVEEPPVEEEEVPVWTDFPSFGEERAAASVEEPYFGEIGEAGEVYPPEEVVLPPPEPEVPPSVAYHEFEYAPPEEAPTLAEAVQVEAPATFQDIEYPPEEPEYAPPVEYTPEPSAMEIQDTGFPPYREPYAESESFEPLRPSGEMLPSEPEPTKALEPSFMDWDVPVAEVEPGIVEVKADLVQPEVSMGGLEEGLEEPPLLVEPVPLAPDLGGIEVEEAAAPAEAVSGVEQEIVKLREILDTGDMSLAIAKYRQILDLFPGNTALRCEIAELYSNYGLLEEAVEQYGILVEKDPECIDYWHRLVTLNLWLGSVDEALRKLLKIARINKERWELDAAIEHLQLVLALEPNNLEAKEELLEIYLAENATPIALFHLQSLAESHLDRKNIRKAIELYKRIHSLTGEIETEERLARIYEEYAFTEEAAGAFTSLAAAYKGRQDWQQAARCYEKIVELIPGNYEARFALVDLYQKMGDQERSIEQKYALANLYLEASDKQKAQEYLEAVLVEKPDNHEARHKLIDIYLEKGLVTKALSESQVLSEVYFKEKRIEAAIDLFQKLVKADSENITLRERLAHFYMLNEQKDAALHEIVTLAQYYEQKEMWDDAIKTYRKALSVEERNAEIHFRLGMIFMEQKKATREAMQEFQKVFEIEPSHKLGSRKFIEVLLREGRPEEAVRVLEKFVSQDPSNASLREEIVESYQARIRENPDDVQSRYVLGIIFKELRMLDNAIEQFQQTKRVPEYFLRSSNMLALCFAGKPGMHEIAVKTLRKAIETKGYREEEYQEPRYNLARLLESLNRLQDALKYYQEIYNVDITYRDVAQRIKQIKEDLVSGTKK